jgi:GxxExxY protein
MYEEIYERSLLKELSLRGIACQQQVRVPLIYKGEIIGEDLRLDLIVEGKVVVETKAVAQLLPIHEAQLITYLKLTRCRVGLLMNFNVLVMKDGIRRLVN